MRCTDLSRTDLAPQRRYLPTPMCHVSPACGHMITHHLAVCTIPLSINVQVSLLCTDSQSCATNGTAWRRLQADPSSSSPDRFPPPLTGMCGRPAICEGRQGAEKRRRPSSSSKVFPGAHAGWALLFAVPSSQPSRGCAGPSAACVAVSEEVRPEAALGGGPGTAWNRSPPAKSVAALQRCVRGGSGMLGWLGHAPPFGVSACVRAANRMCTLRIGCAARSAGGGRSASSNAAHPIVLVQALASIAPQPHRDQT